MSYRSVVSESVLHINLPIAKLTRQRTITYMLLTEQGVGETVVLTKELKCPIVFSFWGNTVSFMHILVKRTFDVDRSFPKSQLKYYDSKSPRKCCTLYYGKWTDDSYGQQKNTKKFFYIKYEYALKLRLLLICKYVSDYFLSVSK